MVVQAVLMVCMNLIWIAGWRFTLSQDWELPIKGFFIVSPKRHIEKLSELTAEERNEMFYIVDKTVKILRDNNICDRFL